MENEYNGYELYVTMECSGQSKQLTFEYVGDYDLWCCWIRGERHFNGDGDTPQQAFEDMIYRMPEMIERMKRIDEARENILIRIQNKHNGDVMWVKYERYDYIHYFHTGFMDYTGGTGIHGEGFTPELALTMFMRELEAYYESGP